jgi:hypothetical protein
MPCPMVPAPTTPIVSIFWIEPMSIDLSLTAW